MNPTQPKINTDKLASRLASLAADPQHRFGSTSPPNSPPSYVSSETTEPGIAPPRGRISWEVVRKNEEIWQKHAKEHQSSEIWQLTAKVGRQIREQQEEEVFRRTGMRISQKVMTINDYEREGLLQHPNSTKNRTTDQDARAPLRRSARIAERVWRTKYGLLDLNKAPQTTVLQTTIPQTTRPGRPRDRPSTKTSDNQKKSGGGTTSLREIRSNQPPTDQMKVGARVAKPRGRPRKKSLRS